ncbi:MAG: cobalt ECF transporter T component CbiQ [Syntrophales bacterium]|nr:cobalt ECF transporter T component CbiQ [Syntrophales bacterium]MDD5233887.1 cobalt ECF transporter T component CbiQ [Syntrophales bacterium]MDD5531471.1 cobalt ECF transporter T component CbiQ [Syntrophales bacterium]
MFELFLDIFAYRDNFWTRMDPGAKLAMALSAIAVILLSSRAVLPLSVFCLCFACMLWIGVPVRLIAVRLTAPMGIVAVLALLKAFLPAPPGSSVLWSGTLYGWKLAATHEGLREGLLIGAKVLGAVGAMLFLSTVTPAHRIFHVLRRFRIPQGWIEVAMLMYRFTFVLVEHASEGSAAQRLRLGYSGIRRSVSSAGMLAGSVILRSFDQARSTHDAMVLRGYKGSFPFGEESAPRRQDLYGAAAVITVLLIFYSALEWRIFS